jgi:hypothetical protein
MKKYKGFSVIFIIPVIVLALSIAGVFAYKLFSEGTKAKASEVPVNKTIPPLQNAVGKPSTGYENVKGPTIKISPTPATVDLETIINETEDTGETDLKAIDTSAAQL